MAGSIKGITIEFRGDTTKLDKALRQVNNETRAIDKELRNVDKALKFNPASVELWRQKQQLLTQKISETKEKLDLLKQQQAAMDAKGVDKNSEEYRKLQREIIETESKLKHFKAELIKIGQVNLRAVGEKFKEIGQKAADAGKAISQKVSAPILAVYTASAKAALNYGDAIAKVSTIADESEVPIKKLTKEILALSSETGKGATELAEAAYQALSASVSTKDVTRFVGEAAKLAKAGFLETADAVDVLTTIINAYGMSAKDADKISNQLIQTQNDGKTTVNELASAMGTVIPTASALNIPLEQLNASYVLLTKQGINTANATTYLNGMFTELADGGSTVSGILQSKTGKSFGQLMKEGATLGDIMQILNDSVNGDSEAFLNLWGNTRAGRGALSLLNGGVQQFNDEVVKMQESTGNIDEALTKLQTPAAALRKALNEVVNAGIAVGSVLAPYIQKAAVLIQGLVEKFNKLSPQTQKIIVIIGAVVSAIGPLLLIGGKLMTTIGTVIIGVGKLISIIQLLLPFFGMIVTAIGPVGLAFLAIAAVVTTVAMIIYKNWDKIKAWTIQLAQKITAEWTRIKTNAINQVNAMKSSLTSTWNTIKSTASTAWNGIKSAITKPIQTAKDTVKKIIDKVKGFFPIKVGNLLSGIKLPHFKISGEFSIKNKTVPKLSVDWYKTGGIFDGPQVIGVGEAGPEAVVPLDKLWSKMDKIAEGGGNTYNFYITGDNPKAIADEIKRILIRDVNRERLAWQ